MTYTRMIRKHDIIAIRSTIDELPLLPCFALCGCDCGNMSFMVNHDNPRCMKPLDDVFDDTARCGCTMIVVNCSKTSVFSISAPGIAYCVFVMVFYIPGTGKPALLSSLGWSVRCEYHKLIHWLYWCTSSYWYIYIYSESCWYFLENLSIPGTRTNLVDTSCNEFDLHAENWLRWLTDRQKIRRVNILCVGIKYIYRNYSRYIDRAI